MISKNVPAFGRSEICGSPKKLENELSGFAGNSNFGHRPAFAQTGNKGYRRQGTRGCPDK